MSCVRCPGGAQPELLDHQHHPAPRGRQGAQPCGEPSPHPSCGPPSQPESQPDPSQERSPSDKVLLALPRGPGQLAARPLSCFLTAEGEAWTARVSGTRHWGRANSALCSPRVSDRNFHVPVAPRPAAVLA